MQSLCRHRRAVQLQRTGAPLLSARAARNWASCRSTWRRAASENAPAMPSRSICAQRLKALAAAARRSRAKSSKCRPGRRCSQPCLPRSTARCRDAPRRRRQTKARSRAFPTSSTSTTPWRAAAAPTHRHRSGPLEFFGVEQSDVYDTLQALLGGITVGYSHRGEGRNPIEIAVRLPKRDLSWSERSPRRPCPPTRCPATARWSNSATSCA